MAEYVVLIAGNISAGKTEMLRYIGTQTDDATIEETIRANALRLFYLSRNVQNDAKKAITGMVENSFLDDRLMNHLEIKHASKPHYIDRGILEGAETFAKNSYEEGNLTWCDYEDYQRRLHHGFDQLDRSEQNKWLERLIVYLEIKDPKVLFDRCLKRGRKDEEISLDYFQRLNDKYNYFIDNIKPIYSNYGLRAPEVLRIPAAADLNEGHLKVFHEMTWKQIQQKMKEMGLIKPANGN